ncbi:hypothetical protein D6T64_03165 [Cryobacterium melibiosiphilum]|uniref:Uncharacterized protein n=1 Tax=Cryobacterium melibiosiphilum TaxID=995039 RepID=A0A3A5MUB1_9MICO|nr:hypothetical protein [Cryobacterium melibiosiphilum]RJT90748.1 hypothetical protein D6T64_03165 [Cryobacterium melibiosiphilum]
MIEGTNPDQITYGHGGIRSLMENLQNALRFTTITCLQHSGDHVLLRMKAGQDERQAACRSSRELAISPLFPRHFSR